MEHIGINSEPFLVTNGLRSLNVFDLVIDDIDTIRAGAALGATAVLTEIDPTVPAWAKLSTKPSYTPAEVGALPDNTFIPSNVSDLTNDLLYVTKGAYVGTCETAAGTAIKVCNCDPVPTISYDDNGMTKYKPVTGIVIAIKFTNTDTCVSAPKLRVQRGTNNGNPIYCEDFGIVYDANLTASQAIPQYTGTANNYIYYIFNGEKWVWLNRSVYQIDIEPGRIYGDVYRTGSVSLFKNTIAGMTKDGLIESIVTSSSTSTSKARNTHGFRLGQFYYNSSSNDVSANTNIPADILWLLYTTSEIDGRYSLNCGTSNLTAHLPIYLVGTISTVDGMFYLENPWWTLTLPTTEDGKVYVDIGVMSSDYKFSFNGGHNAWEFKDGTLKLYDSSYSKRLVDELAQCTMFGLPSADLPSTTDFTNGSINCTFADLRLVTSISPYTTNNVSISDWAISNNSKKLPYKIVIYNDDYTKLLNSTVLYIGTGSVNVFTDSDGNPWSYNWSNTLTKVNKQDVLTAGDGIAISNNTVRTTGIPYGECDSTSTATAFTATVPGIYKLEDGVCCLVKNGVVTSAANFTLNINGLGAKPSYNNMTTGNSITPTAPTRDTTIFNINYAMLFIYSETIVDGGAWICYRGYDANTNTIGYQVRSNSMSLPATQKFYRYRLLFTSADGTHFVPANTSTSTNATASRTVNQTPIDPFGHIVYYGTTAAVEANARPAAANLWVIYTLTLGYSFNRTGAALTLDDWAPIYIKCAPQSDGSAIIDADNPYVQALPSTADGKIYIFLGVAYSATSVELLNNHPVYYHDGTGIRVWTGKDCYSKGEIDIALGNKLDSLVSGTNVKTINNTSILGSGDVDTTELYVVPSNDSTALLYAVNGIILDQNGFNTICENILTALKEGKKLYFEYSIQGESSVTNYTAVSTVYKELTGQTTEVKFIFDYDLALRWIITLTKLNGATNWTASADEITIQEQILTVTSSGNGNAVTNLSILGDTITLDKDKTFIETESDPTVPSWAKASTKPSYDYSEIANTPTIPDELSDLTDDSTHRLVTDTEKTTWNSKTSLFVIDLLYNGTTIVSCSKTYAEIMTAHTAGSVLLANINDGYAFGQLVQKTSNSLFFSCVSAATEDVWSLVIRGNNTWGIYHLNIQPKLTFDTTPTASSTNPVTSGGVYTALSLKQDTLMFDNFPTSGSNNLVKSGSIYSALNGKEDTISDLNTIRTNSLKGISSITSQQDGSIVITLVNGDTYTLILNHTHSAIDSTAIQTGTSTAEGMVSPKTLRDNFYTEGEIDVMIGDIQTLLAAI